MRGGPRVSAENIRSGKSHLGKQKTPTRSADQSTTYFGCYLVSCLFQVHLQLLVPRRVCPYLAGTRMLSRSLLLRGSLLDSLQYMPFSAAASTTVQKPLPFFSKLFGLRTPHAAPSDLSLEPARAAGPGSELQLRTNIGIFGRMNAGKSTLINAITQQNTSIVDAHAGTTADVKTALMEFHAMGPVKLFDTAGADEQGGLGSKKLAKTLSALKESDLVIVVVDAFTPGVRSDLKVERELVRHAMELGKSVLVLFNGPAAAHTTPAATSELIRDLTAPFRTQFPQYFQTQTPPSPSSPSSAPSPSSSSPRAAASRPAAGPRILSITTDLHQPGTGARLVQLIEVRPSPLST
ncbi:hydrogenase maturase HydF [Paratrimastix pyriformis]|uniref:Hydrogenase maturase HydF n=1 Tax=Paratrimastix pyriformis TaxID=342808 RepID=A0ABQ8UBJ5_9EUKA|nr:hydrogenase maturase HydF [Paratrimastix pyriformis]